MWLSVEHARSSRKVDIMSNSATAPREDSVENGCFLEFRKQKIETNFC